MAYRESPTTDIGELERRVAQGIVIGKIVKADYKANRVRVKVGNLETDWIPMATMRAGKNQTWDPYDVGEQVVLASPGGDLTQAVVMAAVHSDSSPAPADDPDITRTKFEDGTVAEHNRKTKQTKLTVPAGGSAITTVGGCTITQTEDSLTFEVGGCTFKFSGAGFEQTGGAIKHDGVIIDKTHKHKDVTPGPAPTGVPVGG